MAKRIDLVMRAPVAALMFVTARARGLDANDLSDPELIHLLAADAMGELNPWDGSGEAKAGARRAAAVAAAADIRDLLTAVVADGRNNWWWSGLARDRQLWVSDIDTGPDEFRRIPDGASTTWQTYAQHPEFATCIDTATALPALTQPHIKSGLHLELSHMSHSDWFPDYPLRQAEVGIRADARVYEVHEPSHWHELVRNYSEADRYGGPDANLLMASGIDHGPAPTWNRVAVDWDGVHLSFFGLITTLFTPTTGHGITTTLWNWTTERTLWLRNTFSDVRELEPLAAPPRIA